MEKTTEADQLIEILSVQGKFPDSRKALLNEFLADESNVQALHAIIENKERLMSKWNQATRIADILRQPLRILNATVGKPYEAMLDFNKLAWTDLATHKFDGLEELGLQYDPQTHQITGLPVKSGEFRLQFSFTLAEESEGSDNHIKSIPFIINPDPRSLWKKIDADRNDPYWKEDDVTIHESLGERHILASSRRGRAHANVGSFREDDFAFTQLPSGWSLVAVADGAGSAKLSRKGSAITCRSVIDYFQDEAAGEQLSSFSTQLQQPEEITGEKQKSLNQQVYTILGKAALFVHKRLEEFAAQQSLPLKDLNATLVFTLFRKLDSGFAFLCFGVGDCPAAVLNKDFTSVELLNQLDVGDYGGGTRFITMPEIFQHAKFASRFRFRIVEDFSYLVLMSDGIYDAKLVVESNLADIKKWKGLLADLAGENEEKIRVEISPDNPEITSQFSAWMDFWSQGNHDDRTLVIVY